MFFFDSYETKANGLSSYHPESVVMVWCASHRQLRTSLWPAKACVLMWAVLGEVACKTREWQSVGNRTSSPWDCSPLLRANGDCLAKGALSHCLRR